MAARLEDWTCRCGRLLMRIARVPGTDIEHKCGKCGVVQRLQVAADESMQPRKLAIVH